VFERFDGSIDEFSYWSDALSAEEVLILYQNKSLQDLPTVTSGTATTTVGIADSSGVHEIGGQLTLGTSIGFDGSYEYDPEDDKGSAFDNVNGMDDRWALGNKYTAGHDIIGKKIYSIKVPIYDKTGGTEGTAEAFLQRGFDPFTITQEVTHSFSCLVIITWSIRIITTIM
jgi:hypothetical protein